MSTRTPAISAAKAVPTFHRDCMVANRHPFSPVDPFDHRTTSTSVIVIEAAIPVTFHRFPRLGIVTSVKDNFPSSLCANVGPVVSFLIVLSVDMFHEVVNPRNWDGQSSFSTTSAGSFVLGQFSLCTSVPGEYSPLIHLHATLLSPHICTLSPSPRVWTVVSTCPMFLSVLSLIFFPIPFTLFDSVFNGSFHSVKNKRDETVLLFQCTFSFSCSHPIFFAGPFRGDFIPGRSHDCATPTCASILCDFLDTVPSFLFVRSATISCSSTYRLL